MSYRGRRRLPRTFTIITMLFAIGALVAPLGPVAAAQPPTISASTTVAAPGTSVTVRGTSFPRGLTVQLAWDFDPSGMPRAVVDRHGRFRVSFRVPPAAAGFHRVSAMAAGSTAPISTIGFRVLASTSPTPSPTPSPVPTPTPSPTATAQPTPTPTATAQPTPTPTPTATAAPTPTPTATPAPTSVTCGTSLQARIDATPVGGTLDLTGCSYGAGATVSRALTIRGATVRPPAGTRGIVVRANDVTLDGLRILGPQATSYRSGEDGVYVSASASNPVQRLTIRNSEIGYFGGNAIWANQVANLVVENNNVHDAVYSGIMVLSGQGGRIDDNTVTRIGVNGASANSNNAYAIVLTDVGAPASTDFTVDGNTITDVPTWHALDTHGGRRINFTNNTIYRSSRGLFITTSGQGRASDIKVTGNLFGSPAPVTYNLLAITLVSTDRTTITGNTISGWGGATFQDFGGSSTNLIYSNNTVTP